MKHFKQMVLVSLALASFLGCTRQTTTSAASSSEILIGEVEAFTGGDAAFGKATHQGTELAIREINEAGGISGKRIRLISLDDQGKSEEAATAVTKLITRDHVIAVLGEISSSRSLAMGPIAQSSQVPMLTPHATHPKVTEIGPYVFRACFTDMFQGKALAHFIFKNLKLKRIAIFKDIKSDYSVGLSDYFQTEFNRLGGEVVSIQGYQANDVDFKSQITSVRAKKPEGIFIPGYYTEVGLIIRQIREMGLAVPLVGGDGWSSNELLEIAGPSVSPAYFSNHFSPFHPSEKVQNFVKNYQSTYHVLPNSLAAASYDATYLLASALRLANPLEPRQVQKQLQGLKGFEGVTGRIRMDENRNALKPVVVLKIENGKIDYHTTIDPEG